MKVLVFTVSALYAGRNSSIPSANWPYKLAEIWTNVKKTDLSGREMQFAWRTFPYAKTVYLKKEIADFFERNGPRHSFPPRTIFLSMINDIEHRRKNCA